jgi:hypothetical protein
VDGGLFGTAHSKRAGPIDFRAEFRRMEPRAWQAAAHVDQSEESRMSKGLDQKKSDKKKPEKTMKEKRAEKKEKKAAKGR